MTIRAISPATSNTPEERMWLASVEFRGRNSCEAKPTESPRTAWRRKVPVYTVICWLLEHKHAAYCLAQEVNGVVKRVRGKPQVMHQNAKHVRIVLLKTEHKAPKRTFGMISTARTTLEVLKTK